MIEFSTADMLMETLSSQEVRPARVELTPIQAVGEALAWVTDQRPFHSSHRNGWTTAIEDALATLKLLGPSLRAALGPDVVPAERSLRSLARLPKSGPSSAMRRSAKTSLEGLLHRFGDRSPGPAAWDDLVQTADDHTVDVADVCWHHRTLQEVVHAAGHDFRSYLWSVRGVLGNNALEVALANGRVMGEPHIEKRPSPSEDAGLSEGERIDLCRRLLLVRTTSGHQIVWVAFEEASLNQMRLDVGPVAFFDGAWVRAVCANPDGPNYASLPRELSHGLGCEASLIPDRKDIILARVDLGTRPTTGAVEVATSVAVSLVAVVRQTLSSGGWHLMDGHLHAVDGEMRAWSSFVSPDRMTYYSPWLDPTEDALRRLAAGLAQSLPATPGSRLEQVLDAVSWYGDSLDRRDAFVDVLLSVRVVELMASWLPDSPNWYAVAKEFYSTWWARQQFIHEASYAVHEALHHSTVESLAPEAHHGFLRSLASRVIAHSNGGTVTDIGQAISSFPRLDAVYPPTSPVARRIRVAKTSLASGMAAAARIEFHRSRFDSLLSRLRRCRNAIAHGGPVSLSVASTTTEFAQTLGRSSLHLALQGEIAGHGTVAVLRDLRDRSGSILTALAAGGKPASALFGP